VAVTGSGYGTPRVPSHERGRPPSISRGMRAGCGVAFSANEGTSALVFPQSSRGVLSPCGEPLVALGARLGIPRRLGDIELPKVRDAFEFALTSIRERESRFRRQVLHRAWTQATAVPRPDPSPLGKRHPRPTTGRTVVPGTGRPPAPAETPGPLLAKEGVSARTYGVRPAQTSVRPVSPKRATRTLKKQPICSGFSKPSDGLEPSTPSLPFDARGNQSQPTATDLACFRGFGGRPICR
jgi:hypothetical protein